MNWWGGGRKFIKYLLENTSTNAKVSSCCYLWAIFSEIFHSYFNPLLTFSTNFIYFADVFHFYLSVCFVYYLFYLLIAFILIIKCGEQGGLMFNENDE